tara:strand:- start:1382 stop:2518 length:1137 start_codon:yes stop_codon:yes gene_type:complete
MTNPRRMQMATAGQGGADIFELYGTLWGSGKDDEAGILGNNALTNPGVSSPVQIKADVTNWGVVVPIDGRTIGLTNSGDLYTWGAGGAGSTRSARVSSPVLISGGAGSGGWSAMSGGKTSWVAIKDGKLYACGTQANGQLGLGDTTARSSPIQVGSLTNWVSVGSAELAHYAINASGQLFSWGDNANGKLGLGNTTDYSSPVQVGSLTNWQKIGISSGDRQTFVKTDGTLWAVGTGDSGEHGQGNTTNVSSPIQIGSATNWTKAGGCANTTMALNSANELWTCGSDNDGGLGLGASGSKSVLTQISGAYVDFFCCDAEGHAVDTAGRLWGWGANGQGQVGDGSTTNRSALVQIGSLTSWVGCAGYGGTGQTQFYLRTP